MFALWLAAIALAQDPQPGPARVERHIPTDYFPSSPMFTGGHPAVLWNEFVDYRGAIDHDSRLYGLCEGGS